MNKYLIILGVLLITACSNGLEKEAKEQMKKTMKELLKNPDSATLTNVKTELNNDSLCIIHFNCKAQNGFGGFTSGKYEYIYLRSNHEGKQTYKEAVLDLDKSESVIEQALDFEASLSDIANKDLREGKSAEERERDSINAIYVMALGSMIFNGREVEKDDGEEIKLK